MSLKFGNTWWGQAYLGALTHIDYENRLARGKSYARNNRIKDISVELNTVEAKVRGSRPKPYKVRIVHTPMSQSNQKKLTQVLTTRPDLISEVMNLRLPNEMMDVCSNLGIRLFPNSWRDLKLTCSCPDWAVPCKHIAAVIYTLSNEIDKDPFLIFKLLNFDLAESLRKKGLFTNHTGSDLHLPDLNSIQSETELERGYPPFDTEIYNTIDLNVIPKLGKAIPQFLEPNPVFYPQGDFRTLLEQRYHHASQIASAEIKTQGEGDQDLSFRFLRKIDYIECVLNPDLSLQSLWLEGPDELMTTSLIRMEDVIDMLTRLHHDEMIMLSPDFKLLHLAWEVAMQCVRNGAIIPSVFSLSHHEVIIRWQPAMTVEPIKQLMASIQQILRQDFISYENAEGHLSYLIPELQPVIITGLFIHHLITQPLPRTDRFSVDAVTALFFQNKTQSFSSFSEQRMGPAIHQWLAPLVHTKVTYVPRIWIHENRNNQFELELELALDHTEAPEWIPLSVFMESKTYLQDRTQVLKALSQLGVHFPPVREAIKYFGNKRILLKEDDVIRTMDQMKGIMQLTGTKIVLPKSLEKALHPKASLQIKGKATSPQSGLLSLDKVLDFNWKIALGDQLISPEEFKKLTESSGRLIKFQDQYIILDNREIESLLAHMAKAKPFSGLALLRYAVTGEYEGSAIQLTQEVKKWLQELRDEPAIKLPQHLRADLRPYQVRGYHWLWKNARLGFGSILADDMGLGKTLQVLTFLQKAKEEGWLENAPVLIVGPATILTNWMKECERFTPQLKACIYHGPKRMIPKEPVDIVITTYGLVRTDQEKLKKKDWSVVIIDEAQNIKSIHASQTRAVWDLPARIRIAMSGTPVENKLSEYFSISHFANPGYLGTESSFKKEFSNPIEQRRDHQQLDVFRRMTAPFLLRRLKTDKTIIQDLPDKIVLNRYSTLTPEQASLYEATTREVLEQINLAESAISRRGLVLKLLLQLKQICNHPVNYLKRGKREADRTGKAEALREVVQQVSEEGRKMLIFTQYREMGDILLEMLKEWGEDAVFLHGGLNRKQRDEIVTTFQDHHWPSILILSIKAAGTGLNLTAATHVIHYDLWWNPAVEAQATDRAFRIGQKHQVTVHRIITRNTLEENIDKLIQQKKELADLTVATGEKWIGELSDQEIGALVGMR